MTSHGLQINQDKILWRSKDNDLKTNSKCWKRKRKADKKHAKNYYAVTLIYSSMNIKYPIKTSFQTFIH